MDLETPQCSAAVASVMSKAKLTGAVMTATAAPTYAKEIAM